MTIAPGPTPRPGVLDIASYVGGEAKIVGVDVPFDLAMLKIDAKNLPTIQWENSKEAKVGRWVASVGPGEDPVAIGVISVAARKYKQGDQPPKNDLSGGCPAWPGATMSA